MTGPNTEPQSQELSFPEKVQWCIDNLGERITAVGAGTSDARNLRNWATGETTGTEHQHRIDLLFAASNEVVDVYGPQTARAFVRGANPTLGDVSVVEVIAATENIEETQVLVRTAVEDFLY